MVERQLELRRRYHRKKKMARLKAKLGTVTGPEREKLIYKIQRLSPWWTEACMTQGHKAVATSTAEAPKRSAPKPKGPQRGPKPEKK